MSTTSFDAIVVGGGVVGAALGYHLARAGAKALLLDRADVGRATDAGAGIVATGDVTDPRSAMVVRAAAYYPVLVAQLQSEQAGETGYGVCGRLLVAVSEDEVEPFAELRLAAPGARYTEISSAEARALFPPLAPVLGALYDRGAARVDGRLLAQALLRAGAAHGLVVRHAGVERLVMQGSAVAGVMVEGAPVAGGAVAIAGGAWSPRFSEQLGARIPVEPQRGQIIHLDLHGADTSTWPIVMAFRSHYMVAWPDSRVVAGATRETGAGFAVHTTAAGVHQVLGEALRVGPGLAGASIREVRVGLRPYVADGLPVLGPVPGLRGAFLATGHGATGLHLGPYSGKLIAELMLGQEIEMDLATFGVDRFG